MYMCVLLLALSLPLERMHFETCLHVIYASMSTYLFQSFCLYMLRDGDLKIAKFSILICERRAAFSA